MNSLLRFLFFFVRCTSSQAIQMGWELLKIGIVYGALTASFSCPTTRDLSYCDITDKVKPTAQYKWMRNRPTVRSTDESNYRPINQLNNQHCRQLVHVPATQCSPQCRQSISRGCHLEINLSLFSHRCLSNIRSSVRYSFYVCPAPFSSSLPSVHEP